MNNDEIRQFQFACSFCILMTIAMSCVLMLIFTPFTQRESLIMLGFTSIAGISGIVLLSTIMIRGWMPKDKK